jgi:hypothetical protein
MPKKAPPAPAADAALAEALERVLLPLARLAVARGQPFPVLQELMKRAFVRAAREMQLGSGHRDISRIATATGLTRREVTRLTLEADAPAPERSSPATQIFTRWLGSKRLRDSRGRPRALPRQGPAPSFEALAQSVTRDVHPRSLLEELCRLGLARHDAERDEVHLLKEAFVPRDDLARMYSLLGRNAGDHLAAGVANVLGEARQHFEQAVFADGLTDASVDAAKKLVNAQWRALMAAIVPELEALVAADAEKPTARRRLRVGLYSYDEAEPDAGPQEP